MMYVCECGALKKSISVLNDVLKDLSCPTCNTKLRSSEKIAKQSKLESWLTLDENNLSDRRKSILSVLLIKPMTDQEITKKLGFNDPNKVRPRRKELVDMNKVKENGKRPCLITGKNVTEWMVV